MLQLSKKMLNFAPLFRKECLHQGKQSSFDPSENLENSKYKGEKSESSFSCSSLYTACSSRELAHIYPCRCEPIFILTYTGIPGPSD